MSQDKKIVYLLTNELWYKVDEDEFEQLKKDAQQIPGGKFSVYEGVYDTDTYHLRARMKVQEMRKNSSPTQDSILEKEKKAPEAPSIIDYNLQFGQNKDFTITDNVKVVEAFFHDSMKRLTLLFHGLCSYTFSLRKSSPLTQMSSWLVDPQSENQSQYRINMRFEKGGLKAVGNGTDDKERPLTVELKVEELKTSRWKLQMDLGEASQELYIQNLKFDKTNSEMAAIFVDEDTQSLYELHGIYNDKKK